MAARRRANGPGPCDRCVAVLESIPGLELACPTHEMTGDGCVSDEAQARQLLAYFKREDIQGLLIGNMTFGMEVAVGTLLSGLRKDMPILHFATRSGPISANGSRSTDTWCGQFMTASAIKRRGFKFLHLNTCNPEDAAFREKMETSPAPCAPSAASKARALGRSARARCSSSRNAGAKSQLQKQFGQMVVPMDLDTAFTRVDAIATDDPEVQAVVAEISGGGGDQRDACTPAW